MGGFSKSVKEPILPVETIGCVSASENTLLWTLSPLSERG